jgi:hypothetical protein
MRTILAPGSSEGDLLMAKRPKHDHDEPVKMDLDPLVALKALLEVDPDSAPVRDVEAESDERLDRSRHQKSKPRADS